MQSEVCDTAQGARRALLPHSPPRQGARGLRHSASGLGLACGPAVEGQYLCAAWWEGTVSGTLWGGCPRPGHVFGTLPVSPVAQGRGAGVPGLLFT